MDTVGEGSDVVILELAGADNLPDLPKENDDRPGTPDQTKHEKPPAGRSKRSLKRSLTTEVSKVDISARTHVGCDGLFVTGFMIFLSGLCMYIVYVFSRKFNFLDRAWVWVYLALAPVFLLVALIQIIQWRKLAEQYSKQAMGREKEKKKNWILDLYSKTIINGPLFLFKHHIGKNTQY